MSDCQNLDLKLNGLCIKSKDLTVEHQNSLCEKICGNQQGKVCSKGCVLQLKADQSDQVFKTGFKLYRNMTIDGNVVDCVVFTDEDKVITLLVNSQEIIDEQLKLINKYSLSKSEMEIIKMFLEGMSQSEIAVKIFISKSTLRTHFNNIYKKVPEKLKKDILDWHFGSKKHNRTSTADL